MKKLISLLVLLFLVITVIGNPATKFTDTYDKKVSDKSSTNVTNKTVTKTGDKATTKTSETKVTETKITETNVAELGTTGSTTTSDSEDSVTYDTADTNATKTNNNPTTKVAETTVATTTSDNSTTKATEATTVGNSSNTTTTNDPGPTISTVIHFKIINRNSGKALDVIDFSVESGANVFQWALHGGTNQQWKFTYVGNGYYKIINKNSNMLLSSINDGTDIVQLSDNGEQYQQWMLIKLSNGYYNIVNRSSGKYLDVLNFSTADGGDVIQWQDNGGGYNQQWYITGQTGNITYTLVQDPNPTADQIDAYNRIKAAMDSALNYYNNLTNISKQLTVYYEPSVQTADASSNGTVRFGSSRSYMNTCTALHEIAHTVGVGQSDGWFRLVQNGVFTGTNTTNELRKITGVSTDQIHGDSMHFWPFGLNYSSEVSSDADYVNHCRIVAAMKADGM